VRLQLNRFDFTFDLVFAVVCSLMQWYRCRFAQVVKLGLGSPRYSLNWVNDGIIVQTRLEAAILSVYLEEYANIGLLDDQLDIIVKIVQPFTTGNFITTTLL
jgi:hypothetical protein